MLKHLDIDPADVDADGICASQTPAAGGSQNLTIAGALTTGGAFHVNDTGGDSTGIKGRRIGIACAGDETSRTFSITGVDPDGNAQTEDVTGVNADTAESVKYWRSISAIAVDDDTAGAITVGTVDEAITRTIVLNHHGTDGATVAVLGLSGTCQFDIDETFEDVMLDGSDATTNWIVAQSNKSADLAAALTRGATGVRLKFDSYTNGAELQFHVTQPSARI